MADGRRSFEDRLVAVLMVLAFMLAVATLVMFVVGVLMPSSNDRALEVAMAVSATLTALPPPPTAVPAVAAVLVTPTPIPPATIAPLPTVIVLPTMIPLVAADQVVQQPVAAQPVVAVASSGGFVVVGEIEWQLVGVTFAGQTLRSDNEFIGDMQTSGQFVQVEFVIKNMGKDTASYTGIDLIDGQGRSYQRSSSTYPYIPDEKECFLEQVNPSVPRSCIAIYEVAADATGLQIEFTDLSFFGNETQTVRLQ